MVRLSLYRTLSPTVGREGAPKHGTTERLNRRGGTGLPRPSFLPKEVDDSVLAVAIAVEVLALLEFRDHKHEPVFKDTQRGCVGRRQRVRGAPEYLAPLIGNRRPTSVER